MQANISALEQIVYKAEHVIVACSGGIDSLLLAIVANRILGKECHIAHSVGPSVSPEATRRVKRFAQNEGWQLHLLEADEFSDENYLSNPANRCFFCKTHLYASMTDLAQCLTKNRGTSYFMMSGTNCDDLSEYRPGLLAADQFGVRHPYVEVGMGKREIRRHARKLNLPFSELPASPCLSSRLYTGTRVTAERLEAIHFSETALQKSLHLGTVRCRLEDNDMRIEVPSTDREKLTPEVIASLQTQLQTHHPHVASVTLDPHEYRPGRAFKVEH